MQQPSKARKFIAYLAPEDDQGPERELPFTLVWKDHLDAEREGASLALNGNGLDKHEATLAWWAALRRLGLYAGGFYQFVDDLIICEADQATKSLPAVEMDPTQQTASTDSV